MTVIAWDGRSIAADKQMMSGDLRVTTTKLKKLPSGAVVAWAGTIDCGLLLAHWFESGGHIAEWPKFQLDKDRWTILVVAEADKVFFYEQEPTSIAVEDKFMAWGSGRQFALAAMEHGATAKEAVEVAIKFCTSCGVGVDVIDL